MNIGNTHPRVLIVDDEPGIRESLGLLLEMENFEVALASGGHEGWKKLDGFNPDVLVTDLRMWEGDGIELIQKVKTRDTHKPKTVVITSFDKIRVEESFRMGAEAFVSKPFDIDCLLQSIRRVLQPPEVRWASPPAIQDSAAELAAEAAPGDLRLARGGIRVSHIQQPLPKLERTLRFKITSSDPKLPSEFEGTGTLRWARPMSEDPEFQEIGVEFEYLEPTCRHAILDWIHSRQPKAFLP